MVQIEPTYFSIFSGIGGFDLALEREGWKCIGYSEIDKHAIQTYEKNFPKSKGYGDAKGIKERELPDFDLLCGGFPCQAFSIAGEGRGFKDTRGTLFFEIARIAKAKKPKYLLLENVRGLLSHNKGETFKIIIQTLEELGYNIEWMVLNSRFFGVPQSRERVFIVGSLRKENRREILPFRESKERIEDKMEQEKEIVIDMQNCNFRKDGLSGTLQAEGLKRRNRGFAILQHSRDCTGKIIHYNLRDIAGTIKQPSGNQKNFVLEDSLIRNLTPKECERLQGFPDDWTKGVSDTQRYKQLGNAVTVNVVSAIIKRMSEGD